MQHLQTATAYLQLDVLDTVPMLKPLQQKTKMKPSALALVLGVFVILVSFLVDVSPLVLGIACVLVPGYLTFEVIGTKAERDYIKYLVYWVVFGVQEILLMPVVSWIFGNTFVMIFGVALTVALLHPKFNMALILYDRIIRTYILKEELKKENAPAASTSQTSQQPKPQTTTEQPTSQKTQ